MGKSKTYEEFVDKFKPKLTTDDCYTPPPVYDAIKNGSASSMGWIKRRSCARFGLAKITKNPNTQADTR